MQIWYILQSLSREKFYHIDFLRDRKPDPRLYPYTRKLTFIELKNIESIKDLNEVFYNNPESQIVGYRSEYTFGNRKTRWFFNVLIGSEQEVRKGDRYFILKPGGGE